MHMIRSIVLSVLAAVLAFGQTRPEFEVASIRPAAVQTQSATAGVRIDGSQVRMSNFSLKDAVAASYRMKFNQVVGPDWISSQRFEFSAKLPDGGSPTQVPEMLQALLVDRFQLKVHRETREFPIYALEVAKSGLKMKELPPDAESDKSDGTTSVAGAGNSSGVSINLGKGSFFNLTASGFEAKKLTMGNFADMLTRFVDRTVVKASFSGRVRYMTPSTTSGVVSNFSWCRPWKSHFTCRRFTFSVLI